MAASDDKDDIVAQMREAAGVRDMIRAVSLGWQALARRPDDLQLHYDVCEFARAAGNRTIADAAMTEAMQRFPSADWPPTYFAFNAIRFGEPAEGLARYCDARNRFPQHVPNILGIAESLTALGLPSLADIILAEGLARHGENAALAAARVVNAASRQDWRATALRLFEMPSPDAEAKRILAAAVAPIIRSGQVNLLDGLCRRLGELNALPRSALLAVLHARMLQQDSAGAWAVWTVLDAELVLTRELYDAAAELLRVLLWLPDGEAMLAALADRLLAEPPENRLDWYPSLMQVVHEIHRSLPASPQRRRLDDVIMAAVGRRLEPSLPAILCKLSCEPALGYEVFEPLARWAIAHTRPIGLCLQLFDAASRNPTDSRRFVQDYVAEGLPSLLNEPSSDSVDVARLYLLLANAFDTASLHTIARALHRLAGTGVNDAVCDIAGRFLAFEDQAAPAIVGRTGTRLRIAVCVSGQLRGFRSAVPTWRHLGLDAHHVTTVVHSWRNIGRRFPENVFHLSRCFAPAFGDALSTAAAEVGFTSLLRSYPTLFDAFRINNNVAEQDVEAVFQAEHVHLEDDTRPPFANMATTEKMHYKIEQAFQNLPAPGNFDLILRMRPDNAVSEGNAFDWEACASRSAMERVVFADVGTFLHRGFGYCMGDQFAAGTPEAMAVYSQTWSRLQNDTQTPAMRACHAVPSVPWLPNRLLPHSSLAYSLFLDGIRAETATGVHLGALLDLPPLPEDEVERCLLTDIRDRPADAVDQRLLRACRAKAVIAI